VRFGLFKAIVNLSLPFLTTHYTLPPAAAAAAKADLTDCCWLFLLFLSVFVFNFAAAAVGLFFLQGVAQPRSKRIGWHG
jgi:hypothetical protein